MTTNTSSMPAYGTKVCPSPRILAVGHFNGRCFEWHLSRIVMDHAAYPRFGVFFPSSRGTAKMLSKPISHRNLRLTEMKKKIAATCLKIWLDFLIV